MVNLYAQLNTLHHYRGIDNTVLRSYNTASVLASFLLPFFVLHVMYDIIFENFYVTKIRACVEILA